MELRNHIVVVHVGRVFEEGSTVDVETGGTKLEPVRRVIPRSIIGVPRHHVQTLAWVVKIGYVHRLVGGREPLILRLSYQYLMFPVGEKFPFVRVEVDVVTEHLRGGTGLETTAALNSNLNFMVG